LHFAVSSPQFFFNTNGFASMQTLAAWRVAGTGKQRRAIVPFVASGDNFSRSIPERSPGRSFQLAPAPSSRRKQEENAARLTASILGGVALAPFPQPGVETNVPLEHGGKPTS